VHDRDDPGGGRIRARVDVRDEPDHCRRVATAACGQRRGDIAVVVDRGVGEADAGELLREQRGELELSRGARALRAVARRLGVDADVAIEAFEQAGSERFGKC